jgi:hypothetical protein
VAADDSSGPCQQHKVSVPHGYNETKLIHSSGTFCTLDFLIKTVINLAALFMRCHSSRRRFSLAIFDFVRVLLAAIAVSTKEK